MIERLGYRRRKEMLLDVLEARGAAISRWHVHSLLARLRVLTCSPGTYFVTNGTHRTVFGWVPPAGLPVGVLERVRDALREAYANACWAELKLWWGQTSLMSPVLVKKHLANML